MSNEPQIPATKIDPKEKEEPFAILEDFVEEQTPKALSITERIKKELLEKEKENPELTRVKKIAQEAQIGLTEKIRKKIEESCEEDSDEYAKKTREQLRVMAEQAKTGLTAKIKKILTHQRIMTMSKANQEWERLKKMAREAQISVTAKIQSRFLPKNAERKEETTETEKSASFLSCLTLVLGVLFLGIFVAFLIEQWLGGKF